jgi:hypothetical protein
MRPSGSTDYCNRAALREANVVDPGGAGAVDDKVQPHVLRPFAFRKINGLSTVQPV